MTADGWWISRASALLGLVAALGAGGPMSAHAQTFDFPVIPRGTFSFESEAIFFKADERFQGPGAEASSVPFGEPWSVDGMGAEPLADLAERIGELTDEPDYSLDVGISGARLELEEIRIPFRLAYGATSWLTVEATVPMYRQRVDATHGFASEGGAVGALADPEAADAFLAALAADAEEASQRADEICDEAGDDAQECQDARDVADSAETFRDGLDDLFGTSPVLPVEDSEAGQGLEQGFVSLREALEDVGVDPQATSVPLPDEPIDESEFQSLFIEPIYGAEGPPLETFTDIWKLGDVEAAVSVLFLDVGADPAVEEDRFPLRFRSGASVRYRFPTAEPDTMRNYVETERHRGVPQLELRSLNDLSWPGRAGLRADLRYARAGSAEVPRRIAPVDRPLDPDAPVARLEWTPGSTFEMDLDARAELTSELALGARYAYLARGSESFDPVEDGEVDPTPLEEDSDIRLHRAGFELAFSSVDAWRGGRTRLPFEVRGGWSRGISGTGVRAPRASRVHLALRLFIPR